MCSLQADFIPVFKVLRCLRLSWSEQSIIKAKSIDKVPSLRVQTTVISHESSIWVIKHCQILHNLFHLDLDRLWSQHRVIVARGSKLKWNLCL